MHTARTEQRINNLCDGARCQAKPRPCTPEENKITRVRSRQSGDSRRRVRPNARVLLLGKGEGSRFTYSFAAKTSALTWQLTCHTRAPPSSAACAGSTSLQLYDVHVHVPCSMSM